MDNETMIAMALARAKISQAELARRLNTTPSNLNQKVKRNTLTKEDMEKISEAVGGEYICMIQFPDGTSIP